MTTPAHSVATVRDFMFMKQLRDSKVHFVAYHWPQWPINRQPEAATR